MTVFFPLFACAQNPGDLDQSFGDNGFATIDINGQGLLDRVSKLSHQPDGKTVFVGGVRNASGTQSDFLLGRITTSGDIDQSFGSQGTTITDIGSQDGLSGLFVKESGQILSGGSSNEFGDYQFLLTQYNSDGSVDAGFGQGGTVQTDIPSTNGGVMTSFVSDLAGHFYAIGSASGDIAIVKYDTNGATDSNYGDMGIVLQDLGLIEGASNCAIQQDGKLVICGTQAVSGNPEDAIVIRLLTDGSLDLSFNGIGWVDLSLSESIDRPTDIKLLPDGRLLVVGFVSEDQISDSEIFALRLMPDGSYDNSFGTNGIARYDIGAGDDYASTVVLQPDGKVLIGGGINENNTIANEDFLVMRINEDGSLDQSFGNNGVVVTEISSSYERIIDMELQSDGMLLVAGTAKIGSSEDIAFARYHTGLNISVPEVANQTEISVYPNPATETIMVKSESRISSVELLDALGRSVLLHSVNANQLQLDLSKIPDGIYLLRASDGKHTFTQKVVKE
jgi:uncharacterized delta-60 repeat protein